jgi:signal transduction histidine kinase
MAFSRLTGRLRDLWIGQPLALLVIAVVVPSACVLWFMNEAVRNQAEATERSVTDLYRTQLRLLRTRVNAGWETRATNLESRLTGNAPADFQKLVAAKSADAVVLAEKDGRPRYPSLAAWLGNHMPAAAEPASDARGDQAVVRELVRIGRRPEAIEALERLVRTRPPTLDAEGRSVAADAHLLLLSLLPATDSRRAPVLAQLTALVNDYERTSLPAAQRAFVMAELEAHGLSRASFPTFEAERLALTYLETGLPIGTNAGLRPTGIKDVWQMSSPSGKVVGLYRTATIKALNDEAIRPETSANLAFVSIAPGEATDDEAVAIGGALPGWSMTFVVRDPAAAGRQALLRGNFYVTVALLAIGVIAAVVVVVVGGVRRQAQMAALKTDLVSTVSHELKTPLASMRLLVDSLLEDGELDAAKTRDYLKLMAGENRRLTRLVENFLTFSKLERKRYQFAFTPTRAEDVVREALAALPEDRRETRAPQITIEPGVPDMVADGDALVTVLLNLLDNAYKYSPPDARIVVRVFRDRRFVVFAVQDNGIGIPAREHRRIFKWFYRVEQDGASITPGTGLGLSIVQAIARAHGGHVRMRSQPPHGTTFEVAVPVAASVT